MMQLGEVIFAKLNKIEVMKRLPTPVSEKEMDGLNYLVGYVIQKLMKKFKKHDKKQAVICLLDSAIEKDCTNDHINTLSRGVLITVTEHCFRIFYKAEEEFRSVTEVDHLRKIDVGSISSKLMDNPDIVSLFQLLLMA